MEKKSINTKMIKIKLPKQRIISLNACNNLKLPTNPKEIQIKPVQKFPIVITKDSIKQRATIVRRDDIDNNVCYFEVFDHSIGKENSATHSPTERVYVTPQIPIKEQIEQSTNNSFEVHNVRVYTDSHKKAINTSEGETRITCEEKEQHEIITQRVIKQCIKKEVKEEFIISDEQSEFKIQNHKSVDTQNKNNVEQFIKKQHEVNKECILDQHEVNKEYILDGNDVHNVQYQYDIQADQDIQNELEIQNETEIGEETEIITEPEQVPLSDQDFEETMDTFFISNKKPDKVTVDKIEDTEEHTHNNTTEYEPTENTQESTQITDQNLFQIATENGTLLLHNNAVIQELIKNGQLIINNGEQDETQEVVLCDSELLDGTEYVLEYADDIKQETVERISCNNCGEEFQSLEEFEIHQNMHKDDENSVTLLPAPDTYLCYCGQKFEDINEFETHQNKHKTNFKLPVSVYSHKFKCHLCSKIYITQSLLDNHMISHEAKATKKKKYNRKTQQSEESLLCDICSKVFKYKSALSMHMKRHIEGKKYECDICKRRFSQRVGLRKHKFTHINPVTCSHCDLIFRDKDIFELHKVEGVCPMETAKQLIQRWTQEATNETSLFGYVCAVCNTFFNTEDELEPHIMTSHILDSTTLFCFECGERASSKEELQAHIVTHIQFYYKKIACHVCGMIFESQARLVVHLRVHTNERPFKCSRCPQTFKTKIHLKSHQLVHTKEKNFPCPVCNKGFALKGNMQAHLRGHTGEKPYVCPLCREGFKDTKILKKHKLMIHPAEDMPWEEYLKVSKTRPSNLALTRFIP